METISNYKKLVITKAKRLLIVALFFLGSPIVLTSSFYLLLKDSNKGKVLGSMVSPVSFVSQLYAALPSNPTIISTEIKSVDGRCLIIERYLKKYNSPLVPYAQLICETSLKYGLDYRLLVAIAQQESNLCKASDPEWFNCWGWGIHSRGTKTFSSYTEAIEEVAKGIKEKYCDKGYCEDPCLMMKKYTPRSNGSWCLGIKQFMEEMEKGFES